MAVIGELATLITARTEPFTKGLRRAGKQADVFTSNIRSKMGRGLDSINSKMMGLVRTIGLLGVGAGVGAVTWAGKLAMDFERAQLSFAVLLKDEKKAADLMKQIQKFAAKTPFSATAVTQAAQKLSAYGYEVGEMASMWEQIGNTAAITGADMVTLAEILGRVRTQNRADLMDVNRIADRAGFFYGYLAKQLGTSSSGVRKMAQEGKITAKIFADAFRDMTTGEGALAGGLDKLSKTVYGRWTSLVDQIKMTLTGVGLEIFDGVDIKSLEDKMIKAIQLYRTDIVDATKLGVDAIVAVLSKAPAWIAWLRDRWDQINLIKANDKELIGQSASRGWLSKVFVPKAGREAENAALWRGMQRSGAREARDIERRAEIREVEKINREIWRESKRAADALEASNTVTVGAL